MRTANKKAASNGRRLCAFRIRDANPVPVFFTGQVKYTRIRGDVNKKASRGRPDVRHWLDDDLDTVSTIFRTESTREVASGRSSSLLLASFLRFP